MRTEEQIVYDLLNIVSGGRVSNDDVISERLVRSYLRTHRAAKLNTFFNKGSNVSDYVFQNLGNLEMKQESEFEFTSQLPAIINFEHSFGIKVSKNRLRIPIVDAESYELSLSNPINKDFPKAKLDGNNLTLYIGKINSCDYDATGLKETTVGLFNTEAAEVDDEPRVYLNVKAVLFDPGSAPGYRWTIDPYPCPSEIIDSIETSTLARNFELMIRQRPDQADNKSQIDNVQ